MGWGRGADWSSSSQMQLASPVDMQVLLQWAQVDLRFSFSNQPQGLQDCWSTDRAVARTGRQRKPGSDGRAPGRPVGSWISFLKTVGRQVGE